MENTYPIGNPIVYQMAKNTKTRVYITKPLTRKPLTGDKYTGLEPAICLYKVEDYDNSDGGDYVVIHVKIYKASMSTNKKTKHMTLLVITYFDHQGTNITRVLHKITVIVFSTMV